MTRPAPDYRPTLIAGPCAIEGHEWLLHQAAAVKSLVSKYDVDFYFKSSFDKANRTSGGSGRGLGIVDGLTALRDVRRLVGVKTTTDVHETWQVPHVAAAVDMLQIPAFLCRQTDLVRACVETRKPVTIKKGQFLSPSEAAQAYDKADAFRVDLHQKLFMIERGTSFGYNNLIVDIPGLCELSEHCPVIFDACHSVQQPGAAGDSTAGRGEYILDLSAAVAATNRAVGFFAEVHPDPASAISDRETQLDMNAFESWLEIVLDGYDR